MEAERIYDGDGLIKWLVGQNELSLWLRPEGLVIEASCHVIRDYSEEVGPVTLTWEDFDRIRSGGEPAAPKEVKGPDPEVWAERDTALRKEREHHGVQRWTYEAEVRSQEEALEVRKTELPDHLRVDALKPIGSDFQFSANGFSLEASSFSGSEIRQILDVAEANDCSVECYATYDPGVIFTLTPRQ